MLNLAELVKLASKVVLLLANFRGNFLVDGSTNALLIKALNGVLLMGGEKWLGGDLSMGGGGGFWVESSSSFLELPRDRLWW